MTVSSNNPLPPNQSQNVQSQTLWTWITSQFSGGAAATSQTTSNPYTPGSQAYYLYQQQIASNLFGGSPTQPQSCFPPIQPPHSSSPGQMKQMWKWLQKMMQQFPFMAQFFQTPMVDTTAQTKFPDAKTGKITFNLTSKDDTVTAGQEYSLTGMKYFLVINGEKQYVSDPNLVEINGLKGNDNINVSQWYANGVKIDGGQGNDTISGTQGNDVIYGGQGTDSIQGNWGDDSIYVGKDSGGIFGFNFGKDTVDGGGGTDMVEYSDIDTVTSGETLKKTY